MEVTPQTKIRFSVRMTGSIKEVFEIKTLAEFGYTSASLEDDNDINDLSYELESALNDHLEEWVYEQTTRDWEVVGEHGKVRN